MTKFNKRRGGKKTKTDRLKLRAPSGTPARRKVMRLLEVFRLVWMENEIKS
jgi:hypothetical protein